MDRPPVHSNHTVLYVIAWGVESSTGGRNELEWTERSRRREEGLDGSKERF
jgi:hypothetical protein